MIVTDDQKIKAARLVISLAAKLLRPFASTDLTSPTSRAFYYLLRAKAVLNEVEDREAKSE